MFCTCSVAQVMKVKWTHLQGIFGVSHCPPKSEFGATNYIWVDSVLVASLKSKMDTFTFVISIVLSPYGHIRAHYMLVCVWNHNNNTWTYVQVDRLSARLFNDTKTEQTTNKRCNAQLSIKSNKGGRRILLQAQGCRGSSNFLQFLGGVSYDAASLVLSKIPSFENNGMHHFQHNCFHYFQSRLVYGQLDLK